MNKFSIQTLLLVVLAVVLAGCAESDPPAFRLDMTNVVAKQISSGHQKAVADILAAMFGTPDEPYALPETGLDGRKLVMAAGPVWSDKAGSKHGLYRRHCAHCHGVSGDGRGPTAAILDPYPRDYRQGVFKFKSTYTAAQPTDADLHRILHDGIPGTAMPSFALLPPDEIAALVEYVKYLSMRGQMETALVNYVFDEGLEPDEPLNPAEDAELRDLLTNDLLAAIVEGWKGAGDQVMLPDEATLPPANRTAQQILESIDKGRELFYGTRANCMKCHGPTALGDGQQDDYDNWSKANQKFIEDTAALVSQIQQSRTELKDLKGEDRKAADEDLAAQSEELKKRQELISQSYMLEPRHAIPRNLREGIYRGGRRPVDIFWRISAGIAGTPMPASGPAAEGAQGTLTQEEIWQVVDYVHSLPFESASLPQTRPVNSEVVSR
jgi:mono/diheme cytochrome c family protein